MAHGLGEDLMTLHSTDTHPHTHTSSHTHTPYVAFT
jgi:hypothetical protein